MRNKIIDFLSKASCLTLHDVDICRDGGTIVFDVETEGQGELSFALNSPFKGEPRLLTVGIAEYSDLNLKTVRRFSFVPGHEKEKQICAFLRDWLVQESEKLNSNARWIELIQSVLDVLNEREAPSNSEDVLSEIEPLKIRINR